jgi:hypothetical protein
MTSRDEAWVPGSCTLPTLERPVRLAEFDELFATALRNQTRLSSTCLRWDLDPAAEAVARELTGRETACCSFFTFSIAAAGAVVQVEVGVPAAYVEVLDALATRAATGMAA